MESRKDTCVQISPIKQQQGNYSGSIKISNGSQFK